MKKDYEIATTDTVQKTLFSTITFLFNEIVWSVRFDGQGQIIRRPEKNPEIRFNFKFLSRMTFKLLYFAATFRQTFDCIRTSNQVFYFSWRLNAILLNITSTNEGPFPFDPPFMNLFPSNNRNNRKSPSTTYFLFSVPLLPPNNGKHAEPTFT